VSGVSTSSAHLDKAEKVFHLPPQADSSLLKRSAGKPVEVFSDQETSLPQISSLPRGRPHSSSLVATRSLRNLDWQKLLALRAAKAWLADWPVTTTRASSARSFLNAQGQERERGVSASPLLEEQWATPLIGPRASPAMLVQLVSQVESNAVRSADTRKRSTFDSPAGNKSFPVISEAAVQRRLDVKPHSNVGTLADLSPRHFEAIPGQDQRLLTQETYRELTVHPGQRATDAQSFSRPSSHFAPPTLSRSLSPLLPAVSPGAPVLPIAAESARDGAWRDEVGAQEMDLSLLAAQMKRILDEEARRHGIDV